MRYTVTYSNGLKFGSELTLTELLQLKTITAFHKVHIVSIEERF